MFMFIPAFSQVGYMGGMAKHVSVDFRCCNLRSRNINEFFKISCDDIQGCIGSLVRSSYVALFATL